VSTNTKNDKNRERQMHNKEGKGTKSPNDICRPDFSSSSMITGQVAWWAENKGENRGLSWTAKFFE
jgi:hypothetical protein